MDSSDIQLLLTLQKIDQEISNLKRLSEQIPKEIEDLNKQKEELVHRFEKIHTEIKRLETLKREKELDIQSYEDRILKIQDALDKVRTNEEYKALLREKAQAEESIMEIEDEILAIMEDIENLQKEEKRIKETLEKEKEEIQKKIKEKEDQLKTVQQKIKKVEEEREQLIKNIKAPLLSRYEMIRKKRGTAVAVVDSDTCTGCYLVIPPKVYSSLVKGEKLLTCPHCGRFLVYEPK